MKLGERAQTSLEYLIILGGAILVATIVTLYLKSIPREVASQAETAVGEIEEGIP